MLTEEPTTPENVTPAHLADFNESDRLRVAIVEDQQLYREMLARLIDGEPGFEVVFSASGAAEARAKFVPGSVDVVIMDVYLHDGNGVALGVSLRRADPRIGVLLLSTHDVMELLLDLPIDMRQGWSYLSKSSTTSTEVLLSAARMTAHGATVIDPQLAQTSHRRERSTLARLSDRQYEVLKLVATGLSNAGIADALGLSQRSVENHINAIYSALDLPRGRNQRVTAVLRFIEETSRYED